MKDKKGQMNIGTIILLIMGIIVGLVIIQAIFVPQAVMTTTYTTTNGSVTLGAVGTWVDITGQNLLGSVLVNNKTHSGTAGTVSGTSDTGDVNVSAAERISTTTGTLRVQIVANNATWANKKVNVTYTYGDEGYINDSGGRSIAGIIGLMTIIALIIFVAYMGLREWI